MKPGCEILIDDRPMSRKGRRMLEAMRKWAPQGTLTSRVYVGQHRLLMMYGAGDAMRSAVRKKHLMAGGHVIMWDMGYFDREEAMRLAIDHNHVSAEQLFKAPTTGREREVVLREDADPDGPVLLVGLGQKSLPHLGLQHLQWELQQLAQIRTLYPDRPVRWRPKKYALPIDGTTMWVDCPIEEALLGCSLAWCRHSNVGVDAIIAGVPVHCEDGAAFALMQRHPQPTQTERHDFIQRLNWFNWKPNEASQAWTWINTLLSSN
jgi:hypothetical protein